MTDTSSAPFEALEPWDEHNRTLAERVHPAGWVNPKPRRRYHLVVVGGGTGGLVTAAIAVALGARVALVERKLLGGDCLNVGCVPSKALIRSARGWSRASASRAELSGPSLVGTGDFGAAMERMRRLRSELSVHDSAQRFQELGVDVFLGEGVFTAPDVLQVGEARLRFKKAVVATGTRPTIPPIPGLGEGEVRTNETIFSLTRLPARLLVIGGGAIGCELAQAFAGLGSRVTLLEQGRRILGHDDPDAAAVVHLAMEASGVEIVCGATVLGAERRGEERVFRYRLGADEFEVAADDVLVAAGRTPNVRGMGLEAAGVRFDAEKGIEVDDGLKSSNPKIYAVGDVAGTARFTHLADAHARMVVRNALFFGRGKTSDLVLPWCTYTSPELAHVGIGYEEASKKDAEIETVTIPYSTVDRARLDGEEEGFLRVRLAKGSDKILGATLVGEGAGDVISQITQAMTAGVGLGKLGETIYPYPTRAEIVRKAADAWRRKKLTPAARAAFGLFFRLRR